MYFSSEKTRNILKMKNIAIFASGSGTNAEAIMTYFETIKTNGRVALLLSNRTDAYALTRAQNHCVPTATFTKDTLYNSPSVVLEVLEHHNVDFIVLAGFMLLVPVTIIRAYEGQIVNIHPALLPEYGGKGMYGDNVHRAVIEAGEPQSGITIHKVDEHYDRGEILFQTTVDLLKTDTAETLAAKIHILEHKYYPQIIAQQL